MTTTTTPTITPSIWDLLKNREPESIHPWLRWHPSQIHDCVRARGEAMPAPLSAAELDEMREFHQRCGAGEDSLSALASLGSPGARVVVAGQQAGILAGPLYSVYKAIGAIKLARDLARRHPGLKFVPVFWVASEDHDFPEVRRAMWPGSGGEIEEVLIDHPQWKPGRMVGRLQCDSIAENLIGRIKASTFETEFRASFLETLAEAYGPTRTWEEAFCRLFFKLFAGTGLVIVSPLMKWVRRRAVPILQTEARAAGKSSRVVIERGERLKSLGLTAEVHRRPDAINFFWIDQADGRHPLRIVGGKIESMSPGEAEGGAPAPTPFAGSVEELASRVEANPESFSFNVVSRPLTQDSIFPTVAQVVGPSEAAYFAQVEALYPEFGVFAPVRFPRPRVLLVQKNVTRTLEKYGLSIDETLGVDASRLARKVIERDLREGIVGELREMHTRHLGEIKTLAASIGTNSAITAAFEKLTQSMEKGYDTVQDRILYSQQEDQHHLGQAMLRIEHSLSPGGQPQERMLNPIVPFWLNYGPGWIVSLMEQMTHDPAAGLQIISMSEFSAKG